MISPMLDKPMKFDFRKAGVRAGYDLRKLAGFENFQTARARQTHLRRLSGARYHGRTDAGAHSEVMQGSGTLQVGRLPDMLA